MVAVKKFLAYFQNDTATVECNALVLLQIS